MNDQTKEPRVGILVAQLGTPDAPTARALRPYLRQFLSDRRVIDYHPLLWQPILRGIILPFRPARSARLYQSIWTPEGSPLLMHSQNQVKGLQERLGDQYHVLLGMRYGNPSIPRAMQAFEKLGIDKIVVLPMYPQFSSTTTASIYDAVNLTSTDWGFLGFKAPPRFSPAVRFVSPYFDCPGYIAALKAQLGEHIAAMAEPPDKIVVSFHGIPDRYIRIGDPYRTQCEETALLLAKAMGWADAYWTTSFQSRFGPEPWLEPYTEEVINGLAQKGIKHPLIVAPGFTADCLETLSELGIEGREQFEEGGGNPDSFGLAPCLNDHPRWLDALAGLVRANSGGWVDG